MIDVSSRINENESLLKVLKVDGMFVKILCIFFRAVLMHKLELHI